MSATELDQLICTDPAPPSTASAAPSDLSSTPPGLVNAIDHLVIQSQDVDATRVLYENHLGLRVLFDREFEQWNMRLCMCRVGDAVLEIAGKLGTLERNEQARPSRDHLWGITWRVGDAAEAHTRLATSGFDLSEIRPGRKPGTTVFTVRNRTHGVPTLMIEHPKTLASTS